jgi:hypothetical protein
VKLVENGEVKNWASTSAWVVLSSNYDAVSSAAGA